MKPKTRGDFPPNPIEKPGYMLEFHDEFDAEALDTNKWLPVYLPHWSSRERSRPRYRLENGQLVLMITEDQPPWCPEFDGDVRCSNLQTGTFSGPVGSSIGQHRFSDALIVREAQQNVRLYTPQYGYFEIRAKGPGTSGNLAALWLIGYEDEPENCAEITLFELFGSKTGREASKISYGLKSFKDPRIKGGFYEEEFAIDTTDFHIYAVEWTPAQIDFYLDNVWLKTVHESPAYAMQFMLNLYEIPGGQIGTINPTDPYPKTFTIDYFRAYQPINGYPGGT